MAAKHAQGAGFSTRAIHHAYDPYAGDGDLNPPIHDGWQMQPSCKQAGDIWG